MKKYSRYSNYSEYLLLCAFYAAQFLGVINCKLDRGKMIITEVKGRCRFSVTIIRFIITVIYYWTIPVLFDSSVGLKRYDYLQFFSTIQAASISFFAAFSFVNQTRGAAHVTAILNRFFYLYQRISQKTETTNLLRGKFTVLILLKLFTTLAGLVIDLPSLLQVRSILDVGQVASKIFGVYLWIGSMLSLDACFLGFLVIAIMYEEMGAFLLNMLNNMKYIEPHVKAHSKLRAKLTHHQRMQLLCEYADRIDDAGLIYADLYNITKEFHYMFQWQIIFYIYYNFMVILLQLEQGILQYVYLEYVDFITIFMMVLKIINLALLLMCADHAVEKSRLPNLLSLDVICSDLDVRWDTSVEIFLSQRQVENLEIKVLGLFKLNNSFILVILSAIMSYLFILIQFGLTSSAYMGDERNSSHSI